MILNEAELYGFPQGSVDSGKVVLGGKNNDWGGSMTRALEIASFAQKCSGKKNVISSQKRSRKKTRSGNTSDHYENNNSAYAVDLPTSGKKGDELLACIMDEFEGGKYSAYKGGKWLNVNVDGYRYQFGWRVKDHFDHIHVGVKNTGESDDDDDESTDTSTEDFNERSKENLKKLIDKLKEKKVEDPELAIKNWISLKDTASVSKYKSFKDIMTSDSFKELEKMIDVQEMEDLNEEIKRIKQILK
jgi:hypothetical protein